jgi:hypothetical protein
MIAFLTFIVMKWGVYISGYYGLGSWISVLTPHVFEYELNIAHETAICQIHQYTILQEAGKSVTDS